MTAYGGVQLATDKRVFTLRLQDEIFDKITSLAKQQHRTLTNYIEFVLLKHLNDYEQVNGSIEIDDEKDD
jgi:hypothetical protein